MRRSPDSGRAGLACGMAKKQSKVVLRAGESIGSPAAEHDHEYLRSCFVNLPVLGVLKDVASPRCLLLGRTGSGKSAILWHLKDTLPNVSRLDPKEASFNYVSNSTIVRHLTEIGVNLHVFYEYLWKHILTLHIIRECLDVRTEHGFGMMLDRIRVFVRRDQRKAAVVQYLETRGGRFWLDAEEVSREVTNTIAAELSTEIGISAPALKSKIDAGAAWKDEEKRVFKYRAQEIISGLQMRELNETIASLSELMGERDAGYYVLIDDLDASWSGDDHTQYALIRALLECIKSFRRIPNLKIVVALREDLYEGVIRATSDRHFQAEKLEGLICRLRWDRDQLNQVVSERLNHLFRSRYTRRGVTIEDILPSAIRGVPTRTFLLERTLRRPRDVIAFVNKILTSNEGALLPLSARAITGVEPSYSRDRLEALVYEWRSCHPLVDVYVDAVARITGSLGLAEFSEDRLRNLICEVEASEREPYDAVERLARQAYERNKEDRLQRLARALICCLFKFGVVGVKLHADQPYTFCYDQQTTLQEGEVGEDTKIVIHPMLLFALGVRQQESVAA
jgi:hypothetical protein